MIAGLLRYGDKLFTLQLNVILMQDDIFAYDIIFGILNPQGIHWTLMVSAL